MNLSFWRDVPGRMWKGASFFACVLVASLASTLPAMGADSQQTSHFATKAGLNLYGGSAVVVSAPSQDAILAGGGSVEIIKATAPGIFAAGGSVTLQDVETSDVVAAGGEVDISGTIADDVISAGGRVAIRRGTKISGDVVVGGGQLSLYGEVGGDLAAAGGSVTLGGTIAGDVTLNAGAITLLPGTRIDGNLSYRSRNELQVPPDVVIGGTVTRGEAKESAASADGRKRPIMRLVAAGIAAWLGVVIALGLFAVAVIAAFPRALGRSASSIDGNFFQSLGVGFAVAVVGPVAIIAFCITIIGIPIGLFLLLCYALFAATAFAIVALWFATAVRNRLRREKISSGSPGQLFRVAAGVVAFASLGLVPLVGNLAQMILLLVGIGALVQTAWADRKAAYA